MKLLAALGHKVTSGHVHVHVASRRKSTDKQITLSDRLAAFISTPRDLRPFVSLRMGQGDGKETGQRARERDIPQPAHLLLCHCKIVSGSIGNIKTGRAAVPLSA